MISFEKKVLSNGLTVIVHPDNSTPLVAVNVLYKVGSRDEDPAHTGFAHLFEHLMFSGSKNIKDFDLPIQMAGGENNAFTNADYTNFYNILPAENIETALWIESDRMANLIIDQQSLDVQKKVVVEEFKETCLNKPYGDVWHNLSSLVYRNHSYRWPTIGIDFSHIEQSKLEDVKSFYDRFYQPSNAILVVAGGITTELGFELVEKWFGDIKSKKTIKKKLPQEPKQESKRKLIHKSDIPVLSVYKAYHMADRAHQDYYTCDLLSDILANGRSSRLIQRLHKEQKLFNEIDAYITGSFDPGLFIIEGKPNNGTSAEILLDSIQGELNIICEEKVSEEEFTKVKNNVESSLIFSEVNILNKAISLAYFEYLSKAENINDESKKYQQITRDDIYRVANEIFREENCSELIYSPQ